LEYSANALEESRFLPLAPLGFLPRDGNGGDGGSAGGGGGD